MSNQATQIAILGTGMAGLGAAHKLQLADTDYIAFDKNHYPGGHTATFETGNGFIFDDGPHIAFSKHQRLRELFARNVDGEYETPVAVVDNYYQGHRIKHPVQCNLFGLPTELVKDCILDFINANQNELTGRDVDNYYQWLVNVYGATIAKTFPAVYGKKYHTVGPERMSTVWLGPRMYRPTLAEVLEGALSPSTRDVHYVSDYMYPKSGGFMSFLKPLIDPSRTKLGHEVIHIDPEECILTFTNGYTHKYSHLISSVPLPKLISYIKNVPDEVRAAANELACTTCVTVNLGIARDDFTNSTWTYVYDEDIVFTRLSFPHMMAPSNCPTSMGSIQAECYYSEKYRPLNDTTQSVEEQTIRDLIKLGVLLESDQIVHRESRVIDFANIIFDLDRESALPIVHSYLESIGIVYVGRYGDWGYQWTDEAFLSGEAGAELVLSAL